MKKMTRKEYAYKHAISVVKRRAIRENDLGIYNDTNIRIVAESWLRGSSYLAYTTIADFKALLERDEEDYNELSDSDKLIYECLD